MRKPLIQCVDTCDVRFTYKYIRNGYVLGDIAIPFYTDLSEEEFNNLLEGKYSAKEIQYYEEHGTFLKVS